MSGASVPAGVVTVAAVDDHPIVLGGVVGWLRAEGSDIAVVGTAATVDGLLAGPGRDADVVLLDLDLADGTTAERNVGAILAAGPAVLILSASDKPLSVRAAAAGHCWVSPRLAYILATDDAPDRPRLSVQETRALQLYATGMALKSVAHRMGLGEQTVKQYLGRVREKYARAGRAAPTKLELYHRAVEDGHLPPPSAGDPHADSW